MLTSHAERASEQPTRVLHIANLSRDIAFASGSTPEQLSQNQVELENEAATLVRTMDGLLMGDEELGLSTEPLAPQLQTIYRGEPDRVTDTLRSYADTATVIARLSEDELSGDGVAQGELLRILDGDDGLAADLQKAVRVYHEETAAEVGRQRTTTLLLLAATLIIATGSVAFLFQPLGRSIHLETSQLERAERMQRESNEFQTYRNNLAEALDTTTNKDEVLAAVGPRLHGRHPGVPGRAAAHRRQPGPPPPRPGQPRAGPGELPGGLAPTSARPCAGARPCATTAAAPSTCCPKLPEHEDTPCSAVCVPVTFNGRASGVIHLVATGGHAPSGASDRAPAGPGVGDRQPPRHPGSTEQRDRQASTDGLTGLINRRELENRARELLLDHRPFAVAMADLDHFKELNDRHGHDSGDSALRLFAAVLKGDLRPSDIAARYGGEEFVILLPDTDVAEAQKTIERLQRSLADQIRTRSFLHFTASWGVTDSESGTNFRNIVGVADSMMYTAKQNGRNLMVIDRDAAGRAGVTPDDEDIVQDQRALLPAPTLDLDLSPPVATASSAIRSHDAEDLDGRAGHDTDIADDTDDPA